MWVARGVNLPLMETSWLRPGQIAWDWYNENNLNAEWFAEDSQQICKTARRGDAVAMELASNGAGAARLTKP